MFRQLLSTNGSGIVEQDANGGIFRDISPVVNTATSRLITSEDLMRGMVITANTTCAYTLVGSEELLLDFPDWQVGAAVSCAIVRGAPATTVSISPSGARPMVALSTNGGTLLAMSRLLVVVRVNATDWRFYCVGM